MTDPLTMEQAKRIPGYAPSKSNETASRMMSDPAWRAQNTSASDGFIDNYYKQSRLHHLSTWKAELRDLVARAQADAENAFAPIAISSGVSMRGAKIGSFLPSNKSGQQHQPASRVILHCELVQRH